MLPNREGRKVPATTFKTRRDHKWVEIGSADLFEGKTVVLFAVPGAYTPTCSSSHLPGYNTLAPLFRARGVDEILCLSVNDAFVMNEWAAAQEATELTLLPDGNGQFSEEMGMLVDKSELGFGKRSWRYSMLVRDGLIEKMFIEPEKDGDPFEVSDAETMLRYLTPDDPPPEPLTMFSKPGCEFCEQARTLLQDAGLPFEEVELGKRITPRTLQAVAGAATTPQIFSGGKHIGGFEALQAWLTGKTR